jgi:hypothetical protein
MEKKAVCGKKEPHKDIHPIYQQKEAVLKKKEGQKRNKSKYWEYIAIVNLYIFFPIFYLVAEVSPYFLIKGNIQVGRLILIIDKIYAIHKNKIKSFFYFLDNVA